MAKKRDVYTGPTLPFPPDGDENLAEAVRLSLHRTIRLSSRSPEQLADALSKRLGVQVSRHVLYSHTAESRPGHRFPLEWCCAWCRETGDFSLLRILCDSLGLPMPEPGQLEKVRFAEARIESELKGQEADFYKMKIIQKGVK
jgi:hypothetical protein